MKKDTYLKLTQPQQEKIIGAILGAKYEGASYETGMDVDVPAGYSIRIAVRLKWELPDEVVKNIFVIQQESNDFITKLEVEEISMYAEQLKAAKVFCPERDEFWVVTNQKWTYAAFEHAHGQIVLTSVDDLFKAIPELYDKDRNLRDTLRHYGLVEAG